MTGAAHRERKSEPQPRKDQQQDARNRHADGLLIQDHAAEQVDAGSQLRFAEWNQRALVISEVEEVGWIARPVFGGALEEALS